jgi:hypothetical protein
MLCQFPSILMVAAGDGSSCLGSVSGSDSERLRLGGAYLLAAKRICCSWLNSCWEEQLSTNCNIIPILTVFRPRSVSIDGIKN